MERYRRFLVDDGLIHLKTDSNFLFTYTRYMVEHNQLPVVLQTEDLYHDDRLDEVTRDILAIQTYYESMWIARGLNIKYMKWQLPHKGTLEEPDVEIELDDYRSYHRTVPITVQKEVHSIKQSKKTNDYEKTNYHPFGCTPVASHRTR